MYRQESDTIQTQLVGEGHLLELISAGTALPYVLDKICTALDVQVGSVVSVVLLPEDEEHLLRTIAKTALRFGLSVFCCAAILSPSEELLGTFETYCCFPRNPTLRESKLIDRATHLAALAIQGHNHERDSGGLPLSQKGAMGRSSQEGPPSKN